MTEHRHGTFQDWCYRCHLSQAEVEDYYAENPWWRRPVERFLNWWYAR